MSPILKLIQPDNVEIEIECYKGALGPYISVSIFPENGSVWDESIINLYLTNKQLDEIWAFIRVNKNKEHHA